MDSPWINVFDGAFLLQGHDDTSRSPDWFLERVSVRARSTGQVWAFQCQQWFDSKRGDFQVVREYYPCKVSFLEEVNLSGEEELARVQQQRKTNAWKDKAKNGHVKVDTSGQDHDRAASLMVEGLTEISAHSVTSERAKKMHMQMWDLFNEIDTDGSGLLNRAR